MKNNNDLEIYAPICKHQYGKKSHKGYVWYYADEYFKKDGE